MERIRRVLAKKGNVYSDGREMWKEEK
jgi:hypothetical protein